jgi:hypothetical protein
MAIRKTTHVLKNTDIISRPLPSSVAKGEPIVNLADGIMLLSGVTQSTSGWTQSGPSGLQPSFFEVGSNLYDLKIRNQITSYSGLTNLSGKFLSGTTNGFVLSDISNIVSGFDVFVTGGTSNNNTKTYTFTNNTGGTFSVIGLTDITITGGTYSAGNATFTNNTGGTFTVTGFTTTDTFTTGFTYTNNNLTIKQNQGQPDLNVLINTMTGLTVNGSLVSNSISATTYQNLPTDVRVTGGTYSAGNALFTNNTGGTFTVTGFTTTDTFTTGFTYTPAQNKLSILQNQGQPSLDVFVTSVSGLTISDLTTNRLVYTTTGGKLITGSATFDGTNMVLPSSGSLNVGTGGLVVGSGGSAGSPGTGDLVVNGNLTVFGSSVSAFTSQLYVEDPNVTFNYNPTGDTTATSIGAGLSVQDGNGINGGNVSLDIRQLNTLTGLTATQIPSITEYSASTGFLNRGWVTQLNDIVIRSTNPTTPNGVRVLAEFDTLDGGQY